VLRISAFVRGSGMKIPANPSIVHWQCTISDGTIHLSSSGSEPAFQEVKSLLEQENLISPHIIKSSEHAGSFQDIIPIINGCCHDVQKTLTYYELHISKDFKVLHAE
jgi:hypothetical protein